MGGGSNHQRTSPAYLRRNSASSACSMVCRSAATLCKWATRQLDASDRDIDQYYCDEDFKAVRLLFENHERRCRPSAKADQSSIQLPRRLMSCCPGPAAHWVRVPAANMQLRGFRTQTGTAMLAIDPGSADLQPDCTAPALDHHQLGDHCNARSVQQLQLKQVCDASIWTPILRRAQASHA